MTRTFPKTPRPVRVGDTEYAVVSYRPGYVVARRPWKGWRPPWKRWGLQVYKPYQDGLLANYALYITSLALQDGKLLVTNEDRQSYRVDLTTRAVEPLGELFADPSPHDLAAYTAVMDRLAGQPFARPQGTVWYVDRTSWTPWKPSLKEIAEPRRRLDKLFEGTPNVTTLDTNQLPAWDDFLHLFPKARGLVQLSPVLWSADRQEATVEVAVKGASSTQMVQDFRLRQTESGFETIEQTDAMLSLMQGVGSGYNSFWMILYLVAFLGGVATMTADTVHKVAEGSRKDLFPLFLWVVVWLGLAKAAWSFRSLLGHLKTAEKEYDSLIHEK